MSCSWNIFVRKTAWLYQMSVNPNIIKTFSMIYAEINSYYLEGSDILLYLSLFSFFPCPPVLLLNNSCHVQPLMAQILRYLGKSLFCMYCLFVNYIYLLIQGRNWRPIAGINEPNFTLNTMWFEKGPEECS